MLSCVSNHLWFVRLRLFMRTPSMECSSPLCSRRSFPKERRYFFTAGQSSISRCKAGNVAIMYKCAHSYEHRLMSLPRKIGRIVSWKEILKVVITIDYYQHKKNQILCYYFLCLCQIAIFLHLL